MQQPQEDAGRRALGERIRTRRQAMGVTGQALAESAEISPSYLSEVERGRSAISGEKLLRIARHLGVSLAYLLEGGPEPATTPGGDVRIPAALSEAASQLGLSFDITLRLLEARRSLVARRSEGPVTEWTADTWVQFYQKVRTFLGNG